MSVNRRRSILDENAKTYFNQVKKTVAGNATVDGSISITADFDFWIFDMNFYNGGATDGDLEIQMRDEGGGFELMNNFVKTNLIFGDGKDPYTLPAATRIPAGSILSIKIKNTTATSRDVQLVLTGVKTPPEYVPEEMKDEAITVKRRLRPAVIRRVRPKNERVVLRRA